MTWIAVIFLAIGAFVLAILLLRIDRANWMIFAAVLTFGLAGYAWQGSPDLSSAPKGPEDTDRVSGEALVEARRSLFDQTRPPADYLILSDAFARRGDYTSAAQLLSRQLGNNPADGEGWLALGNALVEHAGGNVTPAAAEAYARAEQALPGHPGPSFFMGAALLRSGDIRGARNVWQDLLDASPADAPWNGELRARIERMDAVIAQIEAGTVAE